MSGSWIVDRGVGIVDRGVRIVDRGVGIVDRGVRIVDRGVAWGAVVFGVLALGACGDAAEEVGEATESQASPVAEAAAVGTVAGVAVQSPWVRVAIVPEGSDAPDAPPVNSAAYMVLTNASEAADALVAVETEIADTAEVHSVTMDDGVMRMRPVDSVAVPAAGEAVLEPGGFHIMLIGIRRPLAEGDSVPLRVRLRSGAVIDLTAPVLRSPPQM